MVTLDTGRLFPETYQLWAETERHYGRRIRAIYPNGAALERLVARQGIDGIYGSKQARLSCCEVRKSKPLDSALSGAAAWITGLRADQNKVRRDAGMVSFDGARGLLKGGADLILIETSQDILQVKCAVLASRQAMADVGREVEELLGRGADLQYLV